MAMRVVMAAAAVVGVDHSCSWGMVVSHISAAKAKVGEKADATMWVVVVMMMIAGAIM